MLGRCARDGSCAADAAPFGLSARLHWLNGPLLNSRIADDRGRLRRILASGAGDGAIVEEIYRAAFARPPRDEEEEFWRAAIGGAADEKDRRDRLEDFLWSILASTEFTTLH